MDVTALAYNSNLGITRASDPDALLTLADRPEVQNHLETLHAAALFSLAEASSAEFLIRHRGDREDVGGVVRKVTCKYSVAGQGEITSRSPTDPASLTEAIATVDSRGRALYPIDIDLRNGEGKVIASFSFTWFLATDATS